MTKRRKPQRTKREWQPMARGVVHPRTPEEEAAVRERMIKVAGGGEDAGAAADAYLAGHRDQEVWLNDRYVVMPKRREDGTVDALSIRRQDRGPARDWRDFQRIKNEIAGEDVEAFELYPAQERVVDQANQYWLWCLPPGKQIEAGFPKGLLADTDEGIGGSRQRPLPDDWKE